jgi:hypothetical protein
MHKDPPPGILERPPKVIITYGLLTGFVVGIVVIGTWSLFTTGHTKPPKPPPPVADKMR